VNDLIEGNNYGNQFKLDGPLSATQQEFGEVDYINIERMQSAEKQNVEH